MRGEAELAEEEIETIQSIIIRTKSDYKSLLKYEFKSFLGAGGFGFVLKAVEKPSNVEVRSQNNFMPE